jgi:hypothetical protein
MGIASVAPRISRDRRMRKRQVGLDYVVQAGQDSGRLLA